MGIGSIIAISVLFLNKAWRLSGHGLFKTLMVTAISIAALTAVISMSAALWLEMGRNWTRQTALVTAERRVDPWYSKTDDYHYQLSVAGRPLTGELIVGGDDFDPGDAVEVYSAPAGEEHELAAVVEDGPTAAVVAGIGYLVSLPLCWAAGYFTPVVAFEDSRRSRKRRR
ncbi:hypothetical protein Rhe02_68180 [Rhizocola hellebori]|uniref:DUF3592 domain-containing protein n=1 Tax=Rhizocola hellebori TaxID=1392758 RepID=A0A8J3QGA2_9ACTN|nr:hypothetical protein Rhe02_68180 [Rhizocola hellebori]